MIFKKIRKGHADWRNFLCSTPARDYVFQKDAYEDQIDRAAKNIKKYRLCYNRGRSRGIDSCGNPIWW